MCNIFRLPALLMRTAAIAMSVLACTSCIVVPVWMFTEDPYRPEVLQALRNADQAQVRKTLGAPKLTKAGGQYWFYLHSRETWGVIGGSSSTVITDERWLAVEFNQAGRVIFIEANDPEKCLSNGLCLDGAAPTASNLAAEPHRPDSSECGIYLFLEKLPWPAATGFVSFRVDGRVIGTVGAGTYLFLTHPPGQVKLAAYDLAISTNCAGGEKLYVRAIKKRDFSWETGEDLAPVTDAEGAAAIRSRRPALPD